MNSDTVTTFISGSNTIAEVGLLDVILWDFGKSQDNEYEPTPLPNNHPFKNITKDLWLNPLNYCPREDDIILRVNKE
jgi:hypothetical protein